MNIIEIVQIALQALGAIYLWQLLFSTLLGWVVNEERKEMAKEGMGGDVVVRRGPRALVIQAIIMALIVIVVVWLNLR